MELAVDAKEQSLSVIQGSPFEMTTEDRRSTNG